MYAYVHLCFAFMVRYFVSFDVDDTRFPPLWMYCGSGPRKVVSSFATRFTGARSAPVRSGCGTAVILSSLDVLAHIVYSQTNGLLRQANLVLYALSPDSAMTLP